VYKGCGFGSVVGVTGAAVAAGAGRERNQQINLGEEFDEIAGPNGACLHEVLMRVARIASAHEYVHHVVNVKLSFFERQILLEQIFKLIEGPEVRIRLPPALSQRQTGPAGRRAIEATRVDTWFSA
jgi:hypothetical protein